VTVILDKERCNNCKVCESAYPGILGKMQSGRREFASAEVTTLYRAMRMCKRGALIPEEVFW